MPRLPTIRVIGSQAISTTPVSSTVVIAHPSGTEGSRPRAPARPSSPVLLITAQELVAPFPPLGLLVGRLCRESPQRADDRAVERARGGRDPGTGRLVHERHELVGEAGHRAGDADPADVRAAADAVDPAALGDVALHHRAPAAELDQALGRAVLGGEVALLVIAGPVASLVHGRAEQP